MRSRLELLPLGIAVGLLVAAGSATATGSLSASTAEAPRAGGGVFVRWDLVQIRNSVLLAGGVDNATDAATGDTVDLTGSGQAEPREREAAGGGTFIHMHEGRVLAQGVYYVTGFVSWERLHRGSLRGTGLIDAIGNGPGANPDQNEPTSGILVLRVHFAPDAGGAGVDGLLAIHCHLPGTVEDTEEGFFLDVDTLHFAPSGGMTIFHRLK
jgi:hypothetical protein